jgi:hypothetical protein
LLRRLAKLDGWNRALLLAVALYLALWPVEGKASAVYSIRVVLQATVYALAAVVLARVGARAARALARRFLWRVRHRMIVAYLFVGVAPLTLAMVLGVFALLLAVGPLAAYLVTAELEVRSAELYSTVNALGWELEAAEEPERPAIARRFLNDMRARYSGILARIETPIRAHRHSSRARRRRSFPEGLDRLPRAGAVGGSAVPGSPRPVPHRTRLPCSPWRR